jgi:hypothetical protein
MAAAFSRRSVTVDDVVSTSDLPRSVIEACCTNKLPPLQEWLASGAVRVDACCGLPDLAVGAEVMARFHGGDEFYPATVVRGNANGTYAMAYTEHGLVWGEYEACPREQIRLAGSTVYHSFSTAQEKKVKKILLPLLSFVEAICIVPSDDWTSLSARA